MRPTPLSISGHALRPWLKPLRAFSNIAVTLREPAGRAVSDFLHNRDRRGGTTDFTEWAKSNGNFITSTFSQSCSLDEAVEIASQVDYFVFTENWTTDAGLLFAGMGWGVPLEAHTNKGRTSTTEARDIRREHADVIAEHNQLDILLVAQIRAEQAKAREEVESPLISNAPRSRRSSFHQISYRAFRNLVVKPAAGVMPATTYAPAQYRSRSNVSSPENLHQV